MNSTIKVIAEAGINHNGNFKKAIKLVKIAKMADADYVKFQLFKTENFINKEFKHTKINYKKVFKRFKSLEFSTQEWKKIITYGNKIGIKVFFSIFDFESLRIINKLKIKLVKIPSGEINNFPLLKKIKEKNLKVILSTGMSSLSEIKNAIKNLNKKDLTLMHCMSEYPTVRPNLNNIKYLKDKFKIPVGYSDHTEDILTPALSTIAGANIIEKHFTYNKKQKMGDHKFSLLPKELKKMVENVKFAEQSLGSKKNSITKKERNLKFFARRGLYLNKDKFKGQKVTADDIDILRPEGYLPVDKIDIIKNKKLKVDIKKYQRIKKSYFKK